MLGGLKIAVAGHGFHCAGDLEWRGHTAYRYRRSGNALLDGHSEQGRKFESKGAGQLRSIAEVANREAITTNVHSACRSVFMTAPLRCVWRPLSGAVVRLEHSAE